jgi:hypothetical protein
MYVVTPILSVSVSGELPAPVPRQCSPAPHPTRDCPSLRVCNLRNLQSHMRTNDPARRLAIQEAACACQFPEQVDRAISQAQGRGTRTRFHGIQYMTIPLGVTSSRTPGMSCRQKRRALCSSLCKGRVAFDCQLHPFVRRHRVPLPLRS